MRKLLLLGLFLSFFAFTNSQDLKYYLPDSVSYDPKIPKPKDIIYHEVGEWHVTHDRLVNYMRAVAAAAPDRVKLETMGLTYETPSTGITDHHISKKSSEAGRDQAATCSA